MTSLASSISPRSSRVGPDRSSDEAVSRNSTTSLISSGFDGDEDIPGFSLGFALDILSSIRGVIRLRYPERRPAIPLHIQWLLDPFCLKIAFSLLSKDVALLVVNLRFSLKCARILVWKGQLCH